jgi:hypothetical protein
MRLTTGRGRCPVSLTLNCIRLSGPALPNVAVPAVHFCLDLPRQVRRNGGDSGKLMGESVVSRHGELGDIPDACDNLLTRRKSAWENGRQETYTTPVT